MEPVMRGVDGALVVGAYKEAAASGVFAWLET